MLLKKVHNSTRFEPLNRACRPTISIPTPCKMPLQPTRTCRGIFVVSRTPTLPCLSRQPRLYPSRSLLSLLRTTTENVRYGPATRTFFVHDQLLQLCLCQFRLLPRLADTLLESAQFGLAPPISSTFKTSPFQNALPFQSASTIATCTP